MMNLSKDLSELNYLRYQNWEPSTHKAEGNFQNIAIFNGEAFRGFDAQSMTESQLKIAQNKLRILSGLYGILKPLDLIYPYRLEMGTKWSVTSAKKNLYQFWGKKIALHLNDENEDQLLVNCASGEYFKAVDKKTLKSRVITPVFKDLTNGEYKTVMVYAKKARGAMARYIVINDIVDPEDIKGFNFEGYAYDDNLSTEDEWVFTR